MEFYKRGENFFLGEFLCVESNYKYKKMSQKKDFERTRGEFRNLISRLSEQPEQSPLIRSLLQPQPRSRLRSRSRSRSRRTINIDRPSNLLTKNSTI